MSLESKKAGWKGPTIREIAELAGVGSASVDRVLNNRPGVKEKTRKRVLDALEKLTAEQDGGMRIVRVALLCESGVAFNGAVERAATQVNRSFAGLQIVGHYVSTDEVDPPAFARRIEEEGLRSDGVIVVSREHPAVNRAIRKLTAAGLPVVCLTTDLPSSRRTTYVGNDQYAAGSIAAQLIGQILPPTNNNILLVMSAAFRSQQEREMGFRRVLRSDFPRLKIEERMISDDRPETTREQLLKYFAAHGHPAAIYNVAGANRGVVSAMQASGIEHTTVFVGHELTQFTRALLESGAMDYVISHDFTFEVRSAVEFISNQLQGVMTVPGSTPILIHTRYNCDL